MRYSERYIQNLCKLPILLPSTSDWSSDFVIFRTPGILHIDLYCSLSVYRKYQFFIQEWHLLSIDSGSCHLRIHWGWWVPVSYTAITMIMLRYSSPVYINVLFCWYIVHRSAVETSGSPPKTSGYLYRLLGDCTVSVCLLWSNYISN